MGPRRKLIRFGLLMAFLATLGSSYASVPGDNDVDRKRQSGSSVDDGSWMASQNATINRIYRENQNALRPPNVAAPPRPPQRPHTIVKPKTLVPNDFPSLRRYDRTGTPWIIAPEDRPQ